MRKINIPSPLSKAKREAFLPILLATVCMLISLLSTVIDSFVFPFGKDLLSPAIAQIMILLIPGYLCLLLTSSHKSFNQQMTEIGMKRIRAESIFFIIFATAFMITSATILNILFGGVDSAAEGFSILGGFTAGENEYTVSYPYLILTYALIPAFCEEFVFRGIIFSKLSEVSAGFAAVLSTLISTCFALSIGGIPSALLCGLTYCLVLYTANSLQACMIIHFLFNLFSVFFGTNIYRYFLSSQGNTLLIIILILSWLVSCVLFFSEACRIYRKRASKISKNEEDSSLPAISLKGISAEIKDALIFKPTIIVCAIFLALFAAHIVIDFII